MSTGLDHNGQRLMRNKLVTIEDSSSVQSSGRLKLNVAPFSSVYILPTPKSDVFKFSCLLCLSGPVYTTYSHLVFKVFITWKFNKYRKAVTLTKSKGPKSYGNGTKNFQCDLNLAGKWVQIHFSA